MAARQCAPGRRGRSAHRRRRAERRSPSRSGDRGATRVSVFAPDRPGLFYRICAGARRGRRATSSTPASTPPATAWRSTICWSTTRAARPMPTARLRKRLVEAVDAGARRRTQPPRCRRPSRCRAASEAFAVAPSVLIAEQRVDPHHGGRGQCARPRRRCSRGWPRAIHARGPPLHSAHIATYGERAVDVFYLTGGDGRKLDRDEIAALRAALLRGGRHGKPDAATEKGPAGWRGPSSFSASA